MSKGPKLNLKILKFLAILFLLIDISLIGIKIYQEYYKEKKPHPIHKDKPDYKYSIFLTSDDGVLAGSKYLNDLVFSYEFPITLFLVGRPLSQDKNLKPYFSAYKKNPYILLANHSFSHANFHYKRYYQNPQGVEQDFLKNQQYLQLSSHLGRLPGRNVWAIDGVFKGEKNALVAAKILYNYDNYKIFGWDYELHFNKHGEIKKDAMYHYKMIKKLLREGKTFSKNEIVILMHDQMFTQKRSREVLAQLVLLLQDDDECELKWLNEYHFNKTPRRLKLGYR